MASTSSSWAPSPGRHKVNVGSSLSRALKARKGSAPPPKRNNLPDRDFYSVRYAFKPSSIDSTKPGSLDVRRGNDGGSAVTVEHPITQSEDAHVFSGTETATKDWACVLIYDEESGTYTLEKLESFIALEHSDRKRATTADRPSSASSSKTATRQNSVDAGDYEEIPLNSREDSDEDIPLAATQPVSPKKAPLPTAAPSRPIKPLPTPKSRPPTHNPKPPPQTPSSSSHSKTKKPVKRSTPSFSDTDEKAPVVAKPAEPKRARKSSPPPPPPEPRPARLELPGTSTDYAQPLPAPSNPYAASSSRPSNSQPVQLSPSPPAVAADPDPDSEEEDWDEVVGDDGIANVPDDAEMEDAEEEIDMELFGTMIDEELGDEEVREEEVRDDQQEDFLTEIMVDQSPEPEPAKPTGPPVSMRMYVGDLDSDDDSSTDESDDDE